MTGFLGRMAARAVGAAPAVSPRVPSRFELGGGGEAAEATDEAVGTTRAPAPAAPPPTPTVATPVRVTEPTSEPPRGRNAEAKPPATERRAARPPTVTTPVPTPARAAKAPGVPPIGPPREPVSAAEASARPKEVSDQRPVAPVVVAAIPAPQRADALATLPPAADRPGAGERVTPNAPDVVHVSIGRVDVRATVAKPAPAAAAVQTAKQPAGAALSLGDYLRGKRESS